MVADLISWVGLAIRPRRSLEAEILFLRGQLAQYVERGAKPRRIDPVTRVLLALDKICNLRDIIASSPAGWSLARKREYFDWAKSVIDQVRGTNARLEKKFDQLYRKRP